MGILVEASCWPKRMTIRHFCKGKIPSVSKSMAALQVLKSQYGHAQIWCLNFGCTGMLVIVFILLGREGQSAKFHHYCRLLKLLHEIKPKVNLKTSRGSVETPMSHRWRPCTGQQDTIVTKPYAVFPFRDTSPLL